MDKEKILRLCNDIEEIATEIQERTMKDSYYMAQTIINKVLVISAEITAPPKSNADHVHQMTVEELANIFELRDCYGNGYRCPEWDSGCECSCQEGFLKWLRQEVHEDAKKD